MCRQIARALFLNQQVLIISILVPSHGHCCVLQKRLPESLKTLILLKIQMVG